MVKNIVLFTLLLCIASHAFPQTNPVADPASVVVAGKARFTILTPELIRMEWAADKKFEDHASLTFINRRLPKVPFEATETGGWLTIKTAKLLLKYHVKGGRFNKGNLSAELFINDRKVLWKWGDEDSLNLLGTISSLDKVDDGSKVQLEKGIVSRSGWTLVNDSRTSLFDGDPGLNWVLSRKDSTALDCYFFGYGNNYTKAVNDFTRVAGKINMPPLYAFGYWWSRYWAFSDNELEDLVTGMESNKIPLDVVVVDMDWHKVYGLTDWKGIVDVMGQKQGWTGYTWNKELFPDPDKFLSWMKEKGIKNALNIHPASGIMPFETEPYSRMVRALGIDTTKDLPYDKKFAAYAGWNIQSIGKTIAWDITNKRFAKAYFNEVIRPLEKQGVDFFWLDWQQWKETPIKGLSNVYWINHCFYTDMEKNSGVRPMVFHRWGGLGNHRYPIGFSGDSRSNWNVLNFEKYFTATAANVGYSYWSHDIGGHVYTKEFTPELYARWVQFGVFTPVLRTHGTKKPDTERRFWLYPYKYFSVMRDAIQLRYRLVPYIYTAARYTYDTGESICLPMYYRHPDDSAAYAFKGQYYFGNDMIVAPIADSIRSDNNLSPSKVWLPKGEWFDWATHKIISGNTIYTKGYSLGQVPVFIKSGSVIPMYAQLYNLSKKPDTLVACIFPGNTKGSGVYYEDDGNSNQYRNDTFSKTLFSYEVTDKKSIAVTVKRNDLNYRSAAKLYRVDVYNVLTPDKVFAGTTALQWKYDYENFVLSVFLPAGDTDKKLVIQFGDEVNAMYQLFDGLKGKLMALDEVMPFIKEGRALIDGGALPSRINEMGSFLTRIKYQPGTLKEEVKQFQGNYPYLIDEIKKIGLSPQKSQLIIRRLNNEL
ncbi:MAG: glycoside hydrolase family 31 protein [Ferruginibacter sp.]